MVVVRKFKLTAWGLLILYHLPLMLSFVVYPCQSTLTLHVSNIMIMSVNATLVENLEHVTLALFDNLRSHGAMAVKPKLDPEHIYSPHRCSIPHLRNVNSEARLDAASIKPRQSNDSRQRIGLDKCGWLILPISCGCIFGRCFRSGYLTMWVYTTAQGPVRWTCPLSAI